MKPTVENAKLLATLLAVIKQENSKAKDALYEQLYAVMQEEFDNSSGIKYLQVEGIETPIPIEVFRGEKGQKGDTGKQGLIGEQGPIGPLGPMGPQGPQGERGQLGPQGLKGEQGLQGEKGEKGDPGKDGEDFDSTELEAKFSKMYNEFVQQISAQVTRMAYARGGSGGGGIGEYPKTTIYPRDVIPEANNTYSLGSPSRVWKDLYLSGGTIYIGNNFITANDTNDTLKWNNETLLTNTYVHNTFITNADARLLVSTELSALVNSAPVALNTLKELSDALNNDSDFATTVTNSIATKVDTSTFNSVLANTNNYIASNRVSTANWYNANDTIVFTRGDNSTFDVTITGFGSDSGGGGSGNSSYLLVANAEATYQTINQAKLDLANTNAWISSVALSGNTTVIADATSATGYSIIESNINNYTNVKLRKIKGGRNIEIDVVDGDIILTAIPQIDFGYIQNDSGSIIESIDSRLDFGTI